MSSYRIMESAELLQTQKLDYEQSVESTDLLHIQRFHLLGSL